MRQPGVEWQRRHLPPVAGDPPSGVQRPEPRQQRPCLGQRRGGRGREEGEAFRPGPPKGKFKGQPGQIGHLDFCRGERG